MTLDELIALTSKAELAMFWSHDLDESVSTKKILPMLSLLKDLLEKEPRGMCIDYGPNCGYCRVYINDVPEGAPEHADTCVWFIGQKFLGKEETT